MTENIEEEPHRLSFSDLSMLQSTLQNPTTPPPRPDLMFEFSATPAHPAYFSDIIFCGKIIHDEEEEEEDNGLNEYQKRDYFATVKSHSLRKPSESDSSRISGATRHFAEPTLPKCSDLDYHAQRVNITSLTSMSAKSRRRMFMFGPVKFKPEIELSAIRQRQGRPSGKGIMRGRSHLTSVFGCIPAAGRG